VVSEPEHGGLTLPDAVARAMLDHAVAELPNEACGLVSGTLETGLAVAYHPARNSEHSPLRYNVHPDDLLRITLEIDAAGLDLVGIFHSHTHTPAVPSATDLRAAMYSEPFYILATLADPDAAPEDSMRAWRIRGGRSIERQLRIEGEDWSTELLAP